MTTPTRFQQLTQQAPRNGLSQVTAVEQSRAIAEVQAAVVVAQNVPRDVARAEAEVRDVCGRASMANRAFYAVQNRGQGPTVHLMRELARIWGNIQYGVHELHRDDDKGESEIQAFAWDVQTNTRSTRTFIAPHARMKAGSRQKLTDLGDIYLSNQNVGARAVRECISTVLPTWLTEEAQEICTRTLEHGEGIPLPERIDKMIAGFRGISITVEQLEQKIGSKQGAWSAADVARMGVVYNSITRDGLDKDEEFPPIRVTAAEIERSRPAEQKPQDRRPADGQPEAETPDVAPAADELKAVTAALTKAGIKNAEERKAFLSSRVGRPIAAVKDLTAHEVVSTIRFLETGEEPVGDQQ